MHLTLRISRDALTKSQRKTTSMLVESANTIDFADLAATLNLEVIVVVGNRAWMRRCNEAHDSSLRGPRPENRRLHPVRLRSNSRSRRGVTARISRRSLPRPDAASRAFGQDNRRKAHLIRHIGARQLVLIGYANNGGAAQSFFARASHGADHGIGPGADGARYARRRPWRGLGGRRDLERTPGAVEPSIFHAQGLAQRDQRRDVQVGVPADALQSRRWDGSDRSRPRAGLRTARRAATLRRGNGAARRRRLAGRIRAVEAAARARGTVRSCAQTRDALHAATDWNRDGARRRGTARHAAHFVRSISERAGDFQARESAG